jgi:hypothetical protein
MSITQITKQNKQFKFIAEAMPETNNEAVSTVESFAMRSIKDYTKLLSQESLSAIDRNSNLLFLNSNLKKGELNGSYDQLLALNQCLIDLARYKDIPVGLLLKTVKKTNEMIAASLKPQTNDLN